MTAIYIGLMSGTSMDAVDAALVDLQDPSRPVILARHAEPPESRLRSELLSLSQEVAGVTLAKLGELDQRVGHWFADAAENLLQTSSISHAQVLGIGNHGQTLHHAPRGQYPFSLQIGDSNVIAARTGITTVGQFRGADIAAGGEGAPLAPALHHQVFQHASEHRCVINLGGIANVTLLPANADPQDTSKLLGLDTGPASALMDAWISEHLGETQDTDAKWASSGRVDEPLLSHLLQEPYFHLSAPKSTGREHFNLDWLRNQLAGLPQPPDPVHVQRTLCELSARTVVDAVLEYGPDTQRVLLCGGGAKNPLLRERITALLSPCGVELSDDYGVDGDWVEAVAFAWLTMRTIEGLPGNVPSVTGAKHAAVLGGIYRPRLMNNA